MERKVTSHSSSWDKLIQELNNLTLNTGTIQPHLLQERKQERQEKREKSQKQRQQKSKRIFQRLLKGWVK
nr:protein FAM156A/FAM156B-like [Loxodonta africana]